MASIITGRVNVLLLLILLGGITAANVGTFFANPTSLSLSSPAEVVVANSLTPFIVTMPFGVQTQSNHLTFSPDPITVVIGVNNTIAWKNNDAVSHTASSNPGDPMTFDTGLVSPGMTSTPITLTLPGTYGYHCNVHPIWMRGTIIVLLNTMLTVTPQSPGNGVLIDTTYPTLTVKVTSNPAAPVTGANVTIYVNGKLICTNQTAPVSGLVSCSYEVKTPGTYFWNATAQGGSHPAVPPQPTFSFKATTIQSLVLYAGWNMISLPLIPVSNQLAKVLAAEITANDFTIIWSYQGGKWSSATVSNSKLSGALTTMQDGLGYWVYMTKPDILNETGWVILPAGSPPAYPLSAGWNFVGFKPQPDSTQTETVQQYFTSVSSQYNTNSVWIYNNVSGSWTRATATTSLTPGEAIWILMAAPGTLRP